MLSHGLVKDLKIILCEHITLETNLKLLVPLFSTKPLYELTLKLQRMRLHLIWCQFSICYNSGKELGMESNFARHRALEVVYNDNGTYSCICPILWLFTAFAKEWEFKRITSSLPSLSTKQWILQDCIENCEMQLKESWWCVQSIAELSGNSTSKWLFSSRTSNEQKDLHIIAYNQFVMCTKNSGFNRHMRK